MRDEDQKGFLKHKTTEVANSRRLRNINGLNCFIYIRFVEVREGPASCLRAPLRPRGRGGGGRESRVGVACFPMLIKKTFNKVSYFILRYFPPSFVL